MEVHVLVSGDLRTVGGAELGWVADHEHLGGYVPGPAVLGEGVGTLVVGYLPDGDALVGPAVLELQATRTSLSSSGLWCLY